MPACARQVCWQARGSACGARGDHARAGKKNDVVRRHLPPSPDAGRVGPTPTHDPARPALSCEVRSPPWWRVGGTDPSLSWRARTRPSGLFAKVEEPADFPACVLTGGRQGGGSVPFTAVRVPLCPHRRGRDSRSCVFPVMRLSAPHPDIGETRFGLAPEGAGAKLRCPGGRFHSNESIRRIRLGRHRTPY